MVKALSYKLLHEYRSDFLQDVCITQGDITTLLDLDFIYRTLK